ncbi:TonB-dependent siderophore receptor [Paucibacter sp. XJ19-41]|uniref:TonB-dependent siderophore receptor n=1 Tax=Paucibacter sp. XJ19-41 TaxID=2927824 RepID=UPI00234A0456|nr:TonB-dependent siderophore receptor [Paucibacter sp. XJ19-41]MDC6169759.1 TonB-dependent siderophore receptor [Paucibacter sp. XJ19-41]
MLFSTHQRLLTLALAAAFGSLTSSYHPAALAQQQPAQSFDIKLPAQTLSSALAALSSQTGVQVFAAGDLVAGKTAPAVSGRLNARQALDRLLAGSGLSAQTSASGDLTVHRAPASLDEGTLPEVKVRAQAFREEALGPVNGIVAGRSVSGTKTDTALLEVPQSISVVGRDELDARGAQSVMEALRYVPGVTVDSYGVETRGTEWALMRGFDANDTSTLVDGLRLAQSTWINFQTETYGLERIEVLRGPASVTYGQVEAGGTIHRISKRPSVNALREVEVQTGTYGRKQIAADIGGALNAEGSLLYRLVGLALDTDNQLKFANGDRGGNERVYFAPSLMWTPSSSTTLTLRAEAQRNVSQGFSLYVVRNGQNTGLLRGDPKYLRYEQDQSQLGYQLEHRFNETWTLRQNVRYAQSSVDNRYINQAGALVGGSLPRSARHGDDSLRQTAMDTHVQANFGHGGVTHTLLAGLDWNDARTDYKEFHAVPGTTPALNLDAPAYGVVFPSADVLMTSRTIDTRQLGLYLQDQIKFDQRWVLTLGGRDDVVKTRSHNRRNGLRDSQRDHAFSGRAGLSYLAGHGVVPYISYAESFVPQNLKTSAGDPYKPTRGKQWEIGVKVQPADGKSLFTAAWFDLTKTHVETYDPAIDDYLQTGEIRSKGLELEAKTRLLQGLDLHGAYTFNSVKVTQSRNTDLGKTPIQVPRQLASVGLDYALNGLLQGLSFGAGLRYVGKRYDDAANTKTTASFTLVDAALRYEHQHWRFALNVANLLDKQYVASRAYGGYYPGAERSLTLSAKYRF